MFKVGPRFFFGAAERSPQRQLGPFHTDHSVYETSPESGLRITWFGHSSSLIELDGVRILIDPVWDQRAAPMQWTGPKRFFPPPLALENLPPIDAVLISHDHFDHLGAGTVRRLARMDSLRQTRWITSLGVGSILSRLGVAPAQTVELNWTDQVKIGQVSITALPARHFSGRSLFNRSQTLWASFALIGPKHRVYYGADSGEWYGFKEIGERFGPFDITMLEIGASDPLWRDIHMGPEGAVRSFRALGEHGLLMPIHWGLFDLALHHWQQPIKDIVAVEGLKLWSPTPGIPTAVIHGQELRSNWWRYSRGPEAQA
jgi:L-ascorbate metabolism protein UlaG (beta-lactamase superfamily)